MRNYTSSNKIFRVFLKRYVKKTEKKLLVKKLEEFKSNLVKRVDPRS